MFEVGDIYKLYNKDFIFITKIIKNSLGEVIIYFYSSQENKVLNYYHKGKISEAKASQREA